MMKSIDLDTTERIIRPKSGFISINFAEIWRYRELFWFLALRNILIKYKQAVIGIGWAVIRPVLIMIVFTVIFGIVAKMPSNGIPYPLLTFIAVLPWNFFANTLEETSGSLVANQGMISKIYFPRLIMPASTILSGALDFGISFIILIGLMVWYHVIPSMNIFFLPLFLLLAVVTSLGAGLWFSALNVLYRDVKYAVPFMVRFGLYISPVGFLSSVVPDKYRLIYSLNPMVGVIDGFRWCLLGDNITPYWPGLWLSTIFAVAMLISGMFYFRRMERIFADVI